MSRLFTSLKEKAKKMSIERLGNICSYGYVLVRLCWFHLWSLSPDAAKSPWMCGLHFQSSLLGGESSRMLDAILDGLPVLFGTTTALMSPSLVGLCSICWQQCSECGCILLRRADLHVFHHVFRALHQNYSLEWRMLAHDSTYPVHSYNKLRDGGLANRPNSTFMEDLKRLERSPTCIDLSYQRFAPFFSRPPPCSISRALLVSLGSRPLGSSRHTTHRQLSIRARESLLVWSG